MECRKFCPMVVDRPEVRKAEVSVIIPTAGSQVRFAAIRRAICSVLDQLNVKALPIIVLNGESYATDILQYLKNHPSIRFIHDSMPSVSNARLIGRQSVDTKFFAFLDDDDFLEPNGLSACVRHLRRVARRRYCRRQLL